jgi:hypothetical protein
MQEDIIEKIEFVFFLGKLTSLVGNNLKFNFTISQHIFIFVQGYTQEQLEREENVESIQLNVQYQPTATRKVPIQYKDLKRQ